VLKVFLSVSVLDRMDLQRVKNEDKLDLCRKYFYGRFCSYKFL